MACRSQARVPCWMSQLDFNSLRGGRAKCNTKDDVKHGARTSTYENKVGSEPLSKVQVPVKSLINFTRQGSGYRPEVEKVLAGHPMALYLAFMRTLICRMADKIARLPEGAYATQIVLTPSRVWKRVLTAPRATMTAGTLRTARPKSEFQKKRCCYAP